MVSGLKFGGSGRVTENGHVDISVLFMTGSLLGSNNLAAVHDLLVLPKIVSEASSAITGRLFYDKIGRMLRSDWSSTLPVC